MSRLNFVIKYSNLPEIIKYTRNILVIKNNPKMINIYLVFIV